MGHPFFAKRFTFRQPDNSEFEVIGWGNDAYAVFETLDGFTVHRDTQTRIYSYAAIDEETGAFTSSDLIVGRDDPVEAEIQQHLRERKPTITAKRGDVDSLRGRSDWKRRSAEAAKLGMSSMMDAMSVEADTPTGYIHGSVKGLCIPVDFEDEPAALDQQEIERFCNEPGYSGFNNNGSVRDYFFDVSNGQLEYTNLVTPVYRAKHNKTYYTDPLIGGKARTIELIEEAIAHFLAEGFDFASLSISGSGAVYALNVFYAGDNDNQYREGLWPHQWYLDAPIDIGIGVIQDYQITNMGDELSLGTFCHESGHLICAFPDLYDTDLDSAGVGVFCLMGLGGTWDEKNPVEPCAFLKFRAGWFGNVFGVEDGHSHKLPGGENAMAFFMRNNFEYLILEHRDAAGRDSALPSSGLAIWHIDVEMDTNEWQDREPDAHYLCALIQADGEFHLEGNANDGDERDLFGAPGLSTYPNTNVGMGSHWWDRSPTGLRLTNIHSENGVSRFDVQIGSTNIGV